MFSSVKINDNMAYFIDEGWQFFAMFDNYEGWLVAARSDYNLKELLCLLVIFKRLHIGLNNGHLVVSASLSCFVEIPKPISHNRFS